MPRPMTLRQAVVKMTKQLAQDHGTQIRRAVTEEDQTNARMVLRLAEDAFPRTKDYLHFMDQYNFLPDIASYVK